MSAKGRILVLGKALGILASATLAFLALGTTRADESDVDAAIGLGRIYFEGDGVKKDLVNALSMFQKAVNLSPERPDPLATTFLGLCYESPECPLRDARKAIELFQSAASASGQGFGQSKAAARLGFYLETGIEIERNSALAFETYLRGVEGVPPNPECALAVGERLFDGRGVERDPTKAIEYFQKATDSRLRTIPALARLHLIRLQLDGEDVSEEKWTPEIWKIRGLVQGALGDEKSFSIRYDSPEEPKRDEEGAVPEFSAPDAKAFGSIANSLGVRYFAGIGVVKNLETARKWFQVSSLYGNGVATNNLAFCLAAGWGCKKNSEKAIKTALKAVAFQDPISTFPYVALPMVLGVERQSIEATGGLEDEAAKGDERAKEALEILK